MIKNKKYTQKKKKELYRVNEKIKTDYVRVVGENIVSKVCSLQEALDLARQAGLDLVEISSKSNPIVCKIIDYSKFKFEQKKKKK